MTGGFSPSGHLHKAPTQEIMLNKVLPQSMTDEHLLPAALLEMGDSLNFIEVRKHTLRQEIKDSKLSAAAGKFSGLGAIVGGVALAGLSNPLGWLIGGCGLTAYTLSVFGQWLQTGKVHPMPLSSKSQAERDEDLAGQTVSGSDAVAYNARTSIHEDAGYLSDREQVEYELLHFAPQGLLSAMQYVPPPQRWACYQFLVDAHVSGAIWDYANPQALQDILGNPAVYSSHLPEASKRFPQYGLPSAETPQPQTESLPNATDSGPVMASSPIGATTKFGAIEVASSPAGETSTLFNPAIDLGQNPQSALIAGIPGSGKGMVVSNALRVLKQKHPALKVFVIDPKFDPNERGYWDSVADIYRGKAFEDLDDADEGATWILSCLREFQKLPAPKLLIFDESLNVSNVLGLADKELKAPQKVKLMLSSAITGGDSRGIWVWVLGQSVQVQDLPFNGGVRGNLRVLAIVSEKNLTAIEPLLSTKLIPSPAGGVSELRRLIEASPCNRCFFDGKSSRWLPMPKLENHSGFDRDNRTIEANPTVSKNQTETYQEKPAETPNQNDEPEDDAPEIGLNQASVAEVKAQKKELFELGQAILELLQKNPDKAFTDESIRTSRFIESTVGKRPSIATVRESINAVSKLHYVRVDDEGRIQWNQPT